jgi:polyhydroxyalkanoate synthesis repressor PhaR
VVVKKYANRRLYNTESSSYITLDNLAEMVRAGRDFVVFDAKSGEDITRSVLTQIIVEEESKGAALLPTGFLRQLIGFYGDSMQGLVPRYLEQAMSTFARQQQQMRLAMQQTMGNFFPFGIEEMGRQNMAMMERAMSLFAGPFYRGTDAAADPAPEAEKFAQPTPIVPAAPPGDEMAKLRAEIESLRKQLDDAKSADAVAPGSEALPRKIAETP